MIKSNTQVAGGISTVPAGNLSQNVKLDYLSPSIGEKCVRKALAEEEEGGGECLLYFKIIISAYQCWGGCKNSEV